MRIAMVTVWGSLLVFANTFPSYADKRVALVIGNSNYASVAALPNPKRDVSRGLGVAASLKQDVECIFPHHRARLPRQRCRGLIEARFAAAVGSALAISSAAFVPRPH
jgi:hypothetical protein